MSHPRKRSAPYAIIDEPPAKRTRSATRRAAVDNDTCAICLDLPADATTQPCGHTAICAACIPGLVQAQRDRTCSMCRAPVTRIMAAGTERVLHTVHVKLGVPDRNELDLVFERATTQILSLIRESIDARH
jgi:alpha-D-ribose 1-methylphosphonate 5-triphosphate diphosphatase PhnM